jgi:hypothetical protein
VPPSTGRSKAKRPPDPPGLREQIGSTRDSAKRLLDAHVELAKAEFEEIGDAIKRAAVLGGVAIGALLVAALLLTVGLPLFLGEWLFGSIGWGVLLGLLLLVAIAMTAGLAAIGIEASRLGRSILIGVAAAIVVALVLGANLTNLAWSALGDRLLPTVGAESRPLVTALVTAPVVLGVVIGLVMLVRSLGRERLRGSASVGARIGAGFPAAVYVGWLVAFAYAYSSGALMPDWRIFVAAAGGLVVAEIVFVVVGMWGPGLDLVKGLSIGAVLGVVLAFLTGFAFGGRAGAAVGVAVGLIVWPALMGADAYAGGVDTDALKKRFIPQRTMDTAKETIEWARARMPLSRKS